jgi:DNA methylase
MSVSASKAQSRLDLRSTQAMATTDQKLLGVFGSNRKRPFHRWYPFVEGYSADLVARALVGGPSKGVVLDPFGGSGTTALAAAIAGRDSIFVEVNPYMAWVADVKINQARMAAREPGTETDLRKLADSISKKNFRGMTKHPFLTVNESRKYFSADTAAAVVGTLELIDTALSGPTREIARLAVAASLVPTSYMVRRTDLRKRTPSDPAPLNFIPTVVENLRSFADDIATDGEKILGTASHIATDVRGQWKASPKASVVVTSPPYLNGTNYCRNTKLELLALGFISSEQDLRDLRVASISAGINNVSRRRSVADEIDDVERVARKLDKVAYDSRIPEMVRTYFSDMRLALMQIRAHTKKGGHMYFDIGDSRYSGIHVPTHTLLRRIAVAEGWQFLDEEVIRTRRSYDGSQLTQVILHFAAS